MTINGQHTIDELKDLLAAKDFDVAQVDRAYLEFAPTWGRTANSDEPIHWVTDWGQFMGRYHEAHADADAAIARAAFLMVPNSAIPAEDAYQGILHALTATTGHFTDTDFQGLQNRLAAARGRPIDFSGQPKGDATDVDLDVFKGADATARGAEAAGRAVAPAAGVSLLLVGGGLALAAFLLARR